MMGCFDLYAVQLETFLTRLGLWSVVDGSETRPFFDVQGQAVFDARVNAARDAILGGAPDAGTENFVMSIRKGLIVRRQSRVMVRKGKSRLLLLNTRNFRTKRVAITARRARRLML